MKLENRRKLVQVLLEKSRKSLAAAAALAREGFTEAAVSRAYYAAFYLAQAALATQDISRSKHSGVIAAFGQHLTKKGPLPEALHKTFLKLYESRVNSDYSTEAAPSSDETKEALEAAREFAKSVEIYLQEWLTKSRED
ncbi:MAG TPA: HEPN domain-containing protein [Candidatus Binatia bacterium]|nr:HEPN domain-containing protein [Candidatus Binatia bacterium]